MFYSFSGSSIYYGENNVKAELEEYFEHSLWINYYPLGVSY